MILLTSNFLSDPIRSAITSQFQLQYMKKWLGKLFTTSSVFATFAFTFSCAEFLKSLLLAFRIALDHIKPTYMMSLFWRLLLRERNDSVLLIDRERNRVNCMNMPTSTPTRYVPTHTYISRR